MRARLTIFAVAAFAVFASSCLEKKPTPEPIECPDPDDPRVHYMDGTRENPELCHVIDFRCDVDQRMFYDECGCGCIDLEISPECPDPDDPTVHYRPGSIENPEICESDDFDCFEDQTLFSNDCGCGCIDNPIECPDPENPRVHYVSDDPAICMVIDFACASYQTYFGGDCGCGCIDPECEELDRETCASVEGCAPVCSGFCDCTCPGPGGREGCGCEGCEAECFDFVECVEVEPSEPECPDPDDPTVHYIEGTFEDPTICSEMDIVCGSDQRVFSNECGCGCIDICPDPDDPRVDYASEDPEVCEVIDFACASDETYFNNGCGCGCIDICPDPDDPRVSYASEDPEVCEVIDFACSSGETYFNNGCGCGCITDEVVPVCSDLGLDECLAEEACEPGCRGFCDCTCPGPEGYEGCGCEECADECFTFVACVDAEGVEPPPECPDPEDPRVHYASEDPRICKVIDFACSSDQTYFGGECGCGCIDICPDPDDPRVDYASEDPEICEVIDFDCSSGETYFSNGCGCGCIADDPCADLGREDCETAELCEPGCIGDSDCTCPGPGEFEGCGCEDCPAEALVFVECVFVG